MSITNNFLPGRASPTTQIVSNGPARARHSGPNLATAAEDGTTDVEVEGAAEGGAEAEGAAAEGAEAEGAAEDDAEDAPLRLRLAGGGPSLAQSATTKCAAVMSALATLEVSAVSSLPRKHTRQRRCSKRAQTRPRSVATLSEGATDTSSGVERSAGLTSSWNDM